MPGELAAWIGIVVHMGVHSSPATRDCWKHDGLTATGEVVYHLLCKLPNSKYWMVCLDNFCASLPLLGRLRHDFRMGGCATARPNSAGFPPELKIPKQEVKKHK